MNITDSTAKHRSDKEIQRTAALVRTIFNCEGDFLDILRFIEFELPKIKPYFKLRIINEEDTDISLDGVEAVTMIEPDCITLFVSEDTYDRARNGNGRCRFTFAHELAHILLHSDDEVVLARHKDSTFEIRPYDQSTNAETQANKFAAELLAPVDYIHGLKIKEIMEKFGVSRPVAEIQQRKSKLMQLHK